MDLGTYRNGFDCRMLSSVKSARVGSSASSSSDIPPLPQSLPLENITLKNQKYPPSVELKKVLRVPLGNTLEDDHFGVDHSKPTPPLATDKLKKFKDSMLDTSNKARDRAKLLQRSIFILDRYGEDLTSTKQRRTDILFNESLSQENILKVGNHVISNPHAHPPEKLEAKTKSNDLEMNKRLRTLMLNAQADGRSADVPRQPIIVEKDRDMVRTVGGNAIHIEEKIPRLPTGGVGWDRKMKRKRSFGAAGNRAISGESGDRDIKQVIHVKPSAEPKLQPIEAQGCRYLHCCRSRASPGMVPLVESLLPTYSGFCTASQIDLEGVPPLRERTAITEEKIVAKGNNKTNILETHAGSPCSTIKGKLSRTPRTCSVAMLDSSPNVHYSSGADGGGEQATNTSKSMSSSVGNNNEHPMSTSSSASNMAHWVGQRPLQILRTKRSDIVSPLSKKYEAQISSKGFATSDLHERASFGSGGSLLVSSVDIYNPKFKMELENFSSPPALSEGEESGGGENKANEERTGIAEAAVIANDKAGSSTLPTKKNKVLARVKSGDSLGGRGTIGRIFSSTKLSIAPSVEKKENLPAKNPLQSARHGSVTNRSRSGRPPSKKPMVRKTSIHFGSMLNNGSPDHSGELDDDHEELLVASTSARDASYRACSNSFWKKMECYFASFTLQDESYLKHQLNFVEELTGSLYQMPRDEKNALGDPMLKQDSICSGGGTEGHTNQESVMTGGGFGMSKTFDKASPLYQIILSALIEEDESEELNLQNEVRNNIQCASDDSHCGSCNYNDFEPKDRDRMESEVESEVDLHTQKQGLIGRISCDKSVSPNTDSNRSVSSSVCNNESWQADDGLLYSDAGLVPLFFQSDLGFSHSLKVNASPISSSDNQYQMLSLDDRLLMELQCIGLCPETMPHLAEAEEAIDQDILELQEGLVQQAQKMKKTLGKIHKAIPYVKDAERRNMEQVTMSKLIEMAYKRRMVSRGGHSSKRVVRRVSNQVAFAFAERTLSRCRKFEDTGRSCFSEAPLQDIIFSAPLCSSDLNSLDCVVSRAASNRYKRSPNDTSDLRSSGSLSKQQYVSNLHEPILNKRKKGEVLLNDVGSDSSRAEDRNVKMLTNNSVSGSVNPSVDTSTSVCKSKAKSKQKRSYVLASGAELQRSCTEAAHPASTSACASSLSRTIVANVMNKKSELSKEEKEKKKEKDLADFSTEQLTELGSFDNEDYSSLLDFNEDGLQDQDLLGLEIPMDNLSDVHMFI